MLHGLPLHVGPLVEEHLFHKKESVVLTSATLRTSGTFDFLRERKIQGSSMGSNRFRTDMPRLIDLYLQGRLQLDDWISDKIKLEEINDGFKAMKEGKVVRSVIDFGIV